MWFRPQKESNMNILVGIGTIMLVLLMLSLIGLSRMAKIMKEDYKRRDAMLLELQKRWDELD